MLNYSKIYPIANYNVRPQIFTCAARRYAICIQTVNLWFWLICIILAGSCMQGYANGTLDTCFVAFLFLTTGSIGIRLFFIDGQIEYRTFLFTYAFCIFIGGLAQCYSLVTFGNPQSTVDSLTFLSMISPAPPFTTMANMPPVNAPLAVLFWQQIYKLTWCLGLDFGPYIAVMSNAMVMGLTGSITVRIARELFNNDDWRMRRLSILFIFCGMFWLFGAVLIRDCFTTFFNVITLYALVRWLVRPTLWRMINSVILTCISAYAMYYLRSDAVVLFGVYWCLALLAWFLRGQLNAARLLALILVIFTLLVANEYLVGPINASLQQRSFRSRQYAVGAATYMQSDSLGMRLVVNQPMPIRLIVGTGSLMVTPIPLWAGLKSRALDYDLIKAYHGFYQVLVLPLVLAGFLIVCKTFLTARKDAIPLIFIAAYMLMNVAAVVSTSLETRHVAQFLPALLILAVVPDTRNKMVLVNVKIIATRWFTIVALVHMAWVIAKGIV